MKSRISCSVSSMECTEESSRATCRSARSWKTASSSAACRSSRMLRSSSTTLSPSASGIATARISPATAGSAWMMTSVSPLPEPGDLDRVGEPLVRARPAGCSRWARPARTRSARSGSAGPAPRGSARTAPLVRESRHAAAKALGRLVSAAAWKPCPIIPGARELKGDGARLSPGIGASASTIRPLAGTSDLASERVGEVAGSAGSAARGAGGRPASSSPTASGIL